LKLNKNWPSKFFNGFNTGYLQYRCVIWCLN
jgi:hypothetical protein